MNTYTLSTYDTLKKFNVPQAYYTDVANALQKPNTYAQLLRFPDGTCVLVLYKNIAGVVHAPNDTLTNTTDSNDVQYHVYECSPDNCDETTLRNICVTGQNLVVTCDKHDLGRYIDEVMQLFQTYHHAVNKTLDVDCSLSEHSIAVYKDDFNHVDMIALYSYSCDHTCK